MQIDAFNLFRSSDLQRGRDAQFRLNQTQALIDRAQEKITSGKRLVRPSDDAADAVVAQQLRKTLERRQGYESNLLHAERQLAEVDSVLSETTNLLREIHTTALANLSSDRSDAEREGAADVIRSIESQIFNLANTTSNGVSLFGGDAIVGGRAAYSRTENGVQFNGSVNELVTDVGDDNISFQVSGTDVFGGKTARQLGRDLSPALSAGTRLSDVDGARGSGIDRAEIRLSNGGTFTTIDLSQADTIGDVVTTINAAATGVTASINGDHIELSGVNVVVEESGGTTAADLGLRQPPGATVTGDSVRPRITRFTPMADLRGGVGIDQNGLLIREASGDTNIPLGTAVTVGDMLDLINEAGTAAVAEISEDGTTFAIRNTVQGGPFSIQNMSGGGTATQMAVRNFVNTDLLADLNGGRGVRLDPNSNDLLFTDSAGLTFEVDLSPNATMQDVIDEINKEAAAVGSTATASFVNITAGHGMQITDLTAVADIGNSNAVFDLGFDTPISGNPTQTRDVNPVSSEGIFGHIAELTRALELGDLPGAERALDALEEDEKNVIDRRGDVGARMQAIDSRRERLEDENLVTSEMLSRLEDVDYAAAVLEYETLQSSLQVQLQITASIGRTTLFDFLR
ncbi:MAG: flagellin hook IN motif-containing protein [Planctomycetota bacterium]